MQQALLGEVPQVAADGVLGHAQVGHQLRGDDPAVALDPLEDRLSAFSRQHLRVIARTCRFLRLTAQSATTPKTAQTGASSSWSVKISRPWCRDGGPPEQPAV